MELHLIYFQNKILDKMGRLINSCGIGETSLLLLYPLWYNFYMQNFQIALMLKLNIHVFSVTKTHIELLT